MLFYLKDLIVFKILFLMITTDMINEIISNVPPFFLMVKTEQKNKKKFQSETMNTNYFP